MKLTMLAPAAALGATLLATGAPASAQQYYYHQGYAGHSGYYHHAYSSNYAYRRGYHGHYRYWHGHRAYWRNGGYGYYAPRNGVNVWISIPL